MCPHFGFCNVMSLSGKKSELRFEILEILVQIPDGQSTFFCKFGFFHDVMVVVVVVVKVVVVVVNDNYDYDDMT